MTSPQFRRENENRCGAEQDVDGPEEEHDRGDHDEDAEDRGVPEALVQDFVGEDRRHDLVGVVARPEESRDRDPGETREGGGDQADHHVDAGGHREGEADPRGGEPAHEKLPFHADIEQAGAEGNARGDTADKNRRRLKERRCDLGGITECSEGEEPENADRALPDKHDYHGAEGESDRNRQNLSENGARAIAHA